MSIYTNPIMLTARSVGRKIGLNRLIQNLSANKSYEEAFDSALLKTIGKDDVVWDIGANIGYYTLKFADLVGPGGHVVAFEPSPTNEVKLREAVAGRPNISVVVAALGASRQKLTLQQGEDDIGATSRLVESPAMGGVEVEVAPGDSIVEDGRAPAPTVLKIDTEGFEYDILRGLAKTLQRPTLHSVCVEVHFGLLAKRGLSYAPIQIEKMLKSAGFTPHWTDASHVIASRR